MPIKLNNLPIKKRFIFLLAPLFFFSNCALIIHGSRQKMVITCEPKVAAVFINGVSKGNTPLDIRLQRRKHHLIRIELDGYKPYEVQLKRKLDPWIFGNIVFGGLIGIAIDLGTGSVYKLSPKEIYPELTPQRPLSGEPSDSIFITITLQPSPEWEKIGQLAVK